jgi:hypothetical protein
MYGGGVALAAMAKWLAASRRLENMACDEDYLAKACENINEKWRNRKQYRSNQWQYQRKRIFSSRRICGNGEAAAAALEIMYLMSCNEINGGSGGIKSGESNQYGVSASSMAMVNGYSMK